MERRSVGLDLLRLESVGIDVGCATGQDLKAIWEGLTGIL